METCTGFHRLQIIVVGKLAGTVTQNDEWTSLCGEQLAGELAAVLEQTFVTSAHKKQTPVCKTCHDVIIS